MNESINNYILLFVNYIRLTLLAKVICSLIFSSPSLMLQPLVGQGLLIVKTTRSQTHHTWQDSSGQVISPKHRSLYLTTHNTHKKQTSMPPGRFESTDLAVP